MKCLCSFKSRNISFTVLDYSFLIPVLREIVFRLDRVRSTDQEKRTDTSEVTWVDLILVLPC